MERTAQRTTAVGGNRAWGMLGRVGATVIGWCRGAVYMAALTWTVLAIAIRPRHWRRTTRRSFARQLLRTGVAATPLVGLVAFLVGIPVVMQAHLWLGNVGQTGWLGPLLVAVVVRELAPLLTNLVVIGRNGSEMTVELANMTVSGRIRMLDALGIDPLIYVVVPRVVAMVVSTFCLMVVFIIITFASGYLFSFVLGLRVAAPGIFLAHVMRAIRPEDFLILLVSGLLPALMTTLICCSEGMSVPGTSTAVPVATRRALSRSVTVLFLTSAIANVLTYL
jgi:phospholipid/cholesterol/gamma-HCH transport system permease protein